MVARSREIIAAAFFLRECIRQSTQKHLHPNAPLLAYDFNPTYSVRHVGAFLPSFEKKRPDRKFR